jgi:hypothetical protein
VADLPHFGEPRVARARDNCGLHSVSARPAPTSKGAPRKPLAALQSALLNHHRVSGCRAAKCGLQSAEPWVPMRMVLDSATTPGLPISSALRAPRQLFLRRAGKSNCRGSAAFLAATWVVASNGVAQGAQISIPRHWPCSTRTRPPRSHAPCRSRSFTAGQWTVSHPRPRGLFQARPIIALPIPLPSY